MILELVDYKAYLNVIQSEYDDILQTIAEGAEQEVQTYLGFDLESEEKTEYYNGTDSEILVLDAFPVTAVTTISYWDGSDWVDLTSSDYNALRIKNLSSVYTDGYTFTKGTMNYKVVYTAGYTTVPSDIDLAMKKLTRLRWDETPFGLNRLGLNSKNNSGGVQSSLSFKANAEKEIFDTIAKYRHINV